jgi:GNAT superfamily N-acetyltransferase
MSEDFTLVFQPEKLADVKAEAMALIERHWREVALDQDTVPLDPDWQMYDKLEAAGVLHIITARTQGGKLVGYSAYLVTGNLHYRSLRVAETDIFYLDPSVRKGFAGLKLIRTAEHYLASVGVNKVVSKVKLHVDVGPVFERMGYRPIERVYAKTLPPMDGGK